MIVVGVFGHINMHIHFSKSTFSDAKPHELPRLLTKFVDAVDDAVTPLLNSAASSVTLLRSIPLQSGSLNYVMHKLTIKPTSWWVGKKNASVDVWEAKPSDVQYLYLSASANCIVDLFVI